MSNTSHRFSSMRGVTSLAVGALALVTACALPAQAAAQPSSYTVETGWRSDWNGGCAAKATVTYYPSTNKAVMNTTVQSPYAFAACRVRTHLQVRTANTVFEGVDQRETACAVLDPTCASTISTGDQTYSNASPSFADYVDDLNAALDESGLPRTNRQALARGIEVSFSNGDR